MDERIRLFLDLAVTGSLLAFIGLVFGGLVGWWLQSRGRAAGGVFGPPLLRIWERVTRTELSPLTRAVAIGAVEGGTFLALAGVLAGLWVHYSQPGHFGILLVSVTVGLLALGALAFGALGYFLEGKGTRAAGPLMLGAMAGAFVGGCWGGELAARVAGLVGLNLSSGDAMFLALVVGAIGGGGLGGLIAWLPQRQVPKIADDLLEPPPDEN